MLNKRRDIKRFMKTGGIFEQNFGIGRSFDSPLSKDIGGLQRNDKLSIILFLDVDIELHEKNFTVLISKSLLLRLRIGCGHYVGNSGVKETLEFASKVKGEQKPPGDWIRLLRDLHLIGVYTSPTQDSNFGDGKKKVYHLEI
ncbi:hypothetical protein GQX74_000085 [Glossina fuscipes]|nr:hypothetical protein GQX74_000085 [Glossina fuscipes]